MSDDKAAKRPRRARSSRPARGPPPDFTEAQTALQEFLANNPASSLERVETPVPAALVAKPWGDSSLGILISDTSVIGALNKLYLPERFTAIWHLDTNLLEVIFTADPMPEVWKVLPQRSFTFKHKGKDYACEFRKSSNRLLRLAANTLPRGPSRTTYRNLFSFQRYLAAEGGVKGIPKQTGATPLSFWISCIEWDEDIVRDLARHLNFYMTYYDNMSPVIIIHTPESEAAASPTASRFPFGDFPNIISGTELDDNLLHFWAASREGDPFRRFIYNFQILEYAAALLYRR
jgi:hypothetical protein